MDGGDDDRPDDDDLTDEEVRAAIEALTDLDRQKLLLIERRYRAGTDYAEGDLLQAALCQALLRERRCPRDVGFVRTVSLMMRSAGGHRRETLKRQVPFDARAITTKEGRMLAPEDTLGSTDLDPEAAVMERERPDVVTAALAVFAKEEDV